MKDNNRDITADDRALTASGETGAAEAGSQAQEPKKRTSPAVIVILVLIIAACLVGAGFGISSLLQANEQIQDAKNEENLVPATPDDLSASAAKELVDNPIDFAELQAQNPEIYAWIYIPNTKVNHAVVCRNGDNAFYLDHDANGDENAAGAIFSEDYNTTDLQDAVTLIYGHNMADDLMFGSLHYFEDKAFFDENDLFYIYAPGHIYTYRIVSAFTTDDQHVLYRYGYFQTFEKLREFEQEILNPHSIQQNVREANLDDSSKIVVLSTCNSGALEDTARYLVCGVMIDDTATR